jgi:carboxylate-amine ligase
MEMEFQLVDKQTLDLVDGILPLMELYPGSVNVKPEMIQNTVEVASRPCKDTAELEHHMQSLVSELIARCEGLGMRLCGAGTHPFCKRLAAITPQPRYQSMERAAGLLIHNQVTFATHVHMGMPSGDEAIRLMHELKVYLPLLIALSANSPFWHGNDTGYAAYRHRILASSRNYDIPPDFADWKAFEHFFMTMQHARVIGGINNIHWHIRPRPHLGTLEVRVMDAQPTVFEAISLAVFIQGLVLFLQATRNEDKDDKPLQPLSWWSLKDNCFIASRFGIDAQFIVNERGDIEPLRNVALKTLELISPFIDSLTAQPHLEHLRKMIDDGPPYARQRAVYQESGALEEVVRSFSQALSREEIKAPAFVSDD